MVVAAAVACSWIEVELEAGTLGTRITRSALAIYGPDCLRIICIEYGDRDSDVWTADDSS